jgi:hypothetical protein
MVNVVRLEANLPYSSRRVTVVFAYTGRDTGAKLKTGIRDKPLGKEFRSCRSSGVAEWDN